jgi:hypothetical protein
VVDPLPLVRDVLDKQVFDANNVKVGKVDGLILMLRTNRPPRVAMLELSMATAWRRVHPAIGRLIERLAQWLGPGNASPTHIRFEHVTETGIDVHVDIDAKHTTAFDWENWLKSHVISRIPGGRRGTR